jgi:hypothetical protein
MLNEECGMWNAECGMWNELNSFESLNLEF